MGSLSNGISLSTTLKDALTIDASLKYNNDGEVFESHDGYWIEDDLDTGGLLSITVYIKELLDASCFDSLKW